MDHICHELLVKYAQSPIHCMNPFLQNNSYIIIKQFLYKLLDEKSIKQTLNTITLAIYINIVRYTLVLHPRKHFKIFLLLQVRLRLHVRHDFVYKILLKWICAYTFSRNITYKIYSTI